MPRRNAPALALAAACALLAAAPAAAAPSGDGKAAAAEAPATAEVTGFRSARFGMSEAEVRKAIAKDFKVKDAEIRAGDNPVEKTRVLTVLVSDLLPDSGDAVITYLLGYKSKKLFAVNVNWSAATDKEITSEKLVATAGILARHFEAAGYPPQGQIKSLLLPDGRFVVFRGADPAGRTVQVTLLGETAAKDEQRVFTPKVLQLSYIQDPEKPDVFELQPGQF